MAPPDTTASAPTPAQFRAAQNSEEFGELRHTHRSFVWPMTVAFLVWYILFVVLGAFFHDVMSIRLIGNVNLGLVLGLLQFVSTFAITAAYVQFANKKLDPRAAALRERLEAEAGHGRHGEEEIR